MRSYNMTDEAYQAIKQKSPSGDEGFLGKRCADGSWEVPLEDDTYNAIIQARRLGETFSECIIRVAAGREH